MIPNALTTQLLKIESNNRNTRIEQIYTHTFLKNIFFLEIGRLSKQKLGKAQKDFMNTINKFDLIDIYKQLISSKHNTHRTDAKIRAMNYITKRISNSNEFRNVVICLQ